MKKYFNNNGSTMILLVMAIAIISLLGTSILGVTMMNLKIKKTNTEIKQSFYLSESGLDNSYANAYKLVLESVKQSNDDAKDFIDEFKPDNIEFLKNNLPYSLCMDSTTEIGEDGLSHEVYSFKEGEIKIQAGKIFKDNFETNVKNNIVSRIKTAVGENPIVNITNEGSLIFNSNELVVAIDSMYKNDNNIQKTTAVNLVIEVPNYNEPYTVETKIIPINPFWTKMLTAKNLSINSDAEFNGNVYIYQNLNVDGANINPDFKGKLAVRGDVNLNGVNSKTDVKDIYADNILLYGNGAELIADCSGSIDSGTGAYVKDDLEIRNSNQKVLINGSYYGFSHGESGPDTSSGININITDTSSISLEIKDDLYLYGTSYVNVLNGEGDKYQTGESVSVKGNYRAYMEPLLDTTIAKDAENKILYSKDLTNGNINFNNYEYLNFADSFKIPDDKLKFEDKAFYMYFYNEEYKDYEGLKLNLPTTIKLGNVHTVGNTISDGNLKTATYTIGDDDIYKKAKQNYYFETQRLGDETIIYDEDKPEDTALTFNNEINLIADEDSDGDGNNDPININKLNDDDGDGIKELVYVSYSNSGDAPFQLSSGKYEGLIITNGDVEISGNVKFTGSIICGGDIIIDDLMSKTFAYDKNIVLNVIAENDLYKNVFKSNTSHELPIVVTAFAAEGSSDTINVDFNTLLKFNDWQIK